MLLAIRRFVCHQPSQLIKINRPSGSPLLRYYVSNSTGSTEGEQHIINVIKEKLNVHSISVQDISGGCGSMYEVFVSSTDFKGKRMIQQHRLINEVLKEEVKNMHGLRIQTEVPDEDNT